MRLLLLTDAVGGVWVYSLELAKSLAPLGVETVLAVLGPSPKPGQREEARGFKLIDTGLPLDWIAADRGEIKRGANGVVRLAAREGVDLVQTCSAALMAEAVFDQPCIAVQHSCVATWWKTVRKSDLPADFSWRRDLVQRGLVRASAIVAPTKAFAADTESTYELHEPVLAVHNGRRQPTLPDLPPANFALTASRLWDEGKNVATLDAAAAQLDVPFRAAGPTKGPNGSSIDLTNLDLLGQVSASRMAELLSLQPIFVSAAVYEPFGLSVLEAAAAGCALILSDIPSHRELWDDAAVFVEARNDQGFADAIRDLMSSPERRARMGDRARSRAMLYSPERMGRAMCAIYAGVAKPAVDAAA